MANSRRTSKVSIVGAGSVGATIAYACLIRGVANAVTLYDINADKTRAEVLDLNQGIQFVPMAAVTGSEDIAVTADSDIVVVTAGAKQRPGQTRLELAGVNVELCRKLVPQLVELSPNALLLLVTNPVDVLTYAATKFSGLPHHRVVGSGTVLDSSRLRVLLAQHTGVAVQSIHAYIVAEHGDSELPLWSSASIGPIPVSDWTAPRRVRRTTRSASPPRGSSRPCCTTRAGSCPSRRCSTASTASVTSACHCPRSSTAPGSGPCSPHPSLTRKLRRFDARPTPSATSPAASACSRWRAPAGRSSARSR